MRIFKLIFSACLALLLLSCKGDQRGPLVSPVAQASKQESRLLDYSKRSYSDMVEKVYRNLIDSSSALKNLQERLDELDEEKADSTAIFSAFTETNKSYYTSARSHIKTIKDSTLRNRLSLFIVESEREYEGQVSNHNMLLESIQIKLSHINDLNELLKILLTKPEIEKYQRDNLPSKEALQGLSNQLDQLTSRLDSLNKKNGD